MTDPTSPEAEDDLAALVRAERQAMEADRAAAAEHAERQRAASIDPAKAEAALLTGMAVREIASVRNSPIGLIIEPTSGGPELVVVPATKSDADGKTGLMYRTAPRENRTGFPVYAAEPTREQPTEPAPAPDPTPLPAPATDPADEIPALEQALAGARAEYAAYIGSGDDMLVRQGSSHGVRLRRAIEGLEYRLSSLRSRIADAEARANPEAHPRDVKLYVDTLAWAEQVAAASSDMEVRRIAATFDPPVQFYRPHMADREAHAARTWLRARGLDDAGQPLDSPTGKRLRRRRKHKART